MALKTKKRRLHPIECQPDLPRLKKGSYIQTIEFFGNVPRKRQKATDVEVDVIMKLAGLK